VLWAELVALIQPHARGGNQALGGRQPFSIEMVLRIHCQQLWWNLSDLAMKKELPERRCTVALRAGKERPGCPTKPRSCGSGT